MRAEVFYVHPFKLPSEHAHGIQILRTCDALAASGLRVRLPVKRNPERPVASVAEALAAYGLAPRSGFDVEWLPTHHKGISGLALRARILRARGRPVFYVRLLRLAALAARRGPVVVELHNVERDTEAAIRAASAVVTITRALADLVRKRFSPAVPIHVAPDGFDPGTFREVTAPGPTRVVYLGQLMPWKGVEVLLHALARVPALPALLIGGAKGDDPRRRELRRLADALGLGDRVEWAGHLSQSEAWGRLRRGDVGVVPTRAGGGQEWSTSPLKLFELLASGLPVVASDLPALREILTDGESGLLFREGDAESLASALARVAAAPDLAERLRRRGLETVARYTWAARAAQIRDVVTRVASLHAE